MTESNLARSVPIVLQTVEGASVEAEIFVDSNHNLVVLTKMGFGMNLDGDSVLDVARKIVEVMTTS